MSVTVRRFATAADLAAAAAAHFCLAASEAVAARGRFCVVLSGGRTPVVLYRALREPPWVGTVPWQACHVFFSDERCVPPHDSASNFGLAQRELLSRVPIPPGQICRAPTETGEAREVAEAWEQALRAFFGADTAFPEFDLAVLGIGADGHTASLFPGDRALDAGPRWVQPVGPRGAPAVARVTLTLPVLNHARSVVFIAAGADKVAAIKAIEAQDAAEFPAARVQPRDGALWLYSEGGL